MKKIIMVSILLIQITTSTSFANSNDYISNLNNSIGEMKIELEEKNKVSLLKGIDDGYLIPEIENVQNLKNELIGLNGNLKKQNIKNNDLKEKNDLLVKNIDELIVLLNDTIDYKKGLMEESALVKFVKLIVEDDYKVSLANNKIKEINKIYKDINKNL